MVSPPADGRIVEVLDTEYEGREITKISIFMNVFNVHVNRMPIGGTLKAVTHKAGKFLAADKPEASYENEQNVIDISTEYGEVTVKQVQVCLREGLSAMPQWVILSLSASVSG